MNRTEGNPGGRYKGVAYFNGGLYAHPAEIELKAEERTLLNEACDFDWSKVRPEIFGTLFEHSLGEAERHAQGAHFTSPVDIMKIVGPIIVEPWRAAIEGTKTLTEMQALAHRMPTFTVLDPACGSGNFLFTAYRDDPASRAHGRLPPPRDSIVASPPVR
jgi:type II restriction/modification system DNA methylase subunit YeeA